MRLLKNKLNNQGFTLMEILVATTVFSIVFIAILSLFYYIIRLNTQIEAVRISSQTTRAFTDFLTKEIRNGNIDYSGLVSPCPSTYSNTGTNALGIINTTGDQECFYLNAGNLYVTKRSVSGQITTQQINPNNISIDQSTFRFIVKPATNPRVATAGTYPGVQPFVSISMVIQAKIGSTSTTLKMPYQTTISVDAYDIPPKGP